MQRQTWVAICWLLSLSTVMAGAGSVQPDTPRWGDTVRVRYDPTAEHAAFTVRDEVYVVAFLSYPDRVEQVWWPMELVEDVFHAEIRVQNELSFAELFFVTPWSWDSRADTTTMIFRPDGKPARGALQHGMNDQTASRQLILERELYPENYWVYRDAWMAMRRTGELGDATLRSELDRLEAQSGDLPPDHDFAVMYGYLLLGDEPRARRSLLEMIERHPESALVYRAATDYEYHVLIKSVQGDGPRLVADVMHQWVQGQEPDSLVARKRFEKLAYDVQVPLETLEPIFAAWIQEQPENPVPYLALAIGLKLRGLDAPRALDLYWKGINLGLIGKHRLYEDPGGKAFAHGLPYYYKDIAELAAQEGLVAQALAATRAAQALGPAPGAAQIAEGELWESVGAFKRAERAYVEALENVPDEAAASLESLFLRRRGSTDGFAGYLQEKESALADARGMRLAPEFSLTTLDGLEVSNATLRGGVAVINFWFSGCGPCIAEMPALNRLVAEFADEPVVFLAPSLDEELPLRRFLEGIEFNYRIAADSAVTHQAFDVQAYPTHIVIDTRGVVRHERRGGDETIQDVLRPLIRQLLPADGE